MKKIFLPLYLTASLAVAPVVLIGCGGGSSSNQSNSLSGANLTFSTSETPNVYPPLNVRGVMRGTFDNQLGLQTTPSSGVYTAFDKKDGDFPAGTGFIVNFVRSKVNNMDRLLIFSRTTTSGTEAPAGTVFDFSEDNPDRTGFGFSLYQLDGTSESTYTYGSNGGTVTVTSIENDLVTLQLSDVELVRVSVDNVALPEFVTLDGTVKYNLNDIQNNDIVVGSVGSAKKANQLPPYLQKYFKK